MAGAGSDNHHRGGEILADVIVKVDVELGATGQAVNQSDPVLLPLSIDGEAAGTPITWQPMRIAVASRPEFAPKLRQRRSALSVHLALVVLAVCPSGLMILILAGLPA